jgi:hypothetical protein
MPYLSACFTVSATEGISVNLSITDLHQRLSDNVLIPTADREMYVYVKSG